MALQRKKKVVNQDTFPYPDCRVRLSSDLIIQNINEMTNEEQKYQNSEFKKVFKNERVA